MTWRDGGLVGFALEATGQSGAAGAALVTFTPGRSLDTVKWDGVPAGQQPEMFDLLASGLLRAVASGVPVVGHNVAQSLSILDARCREFGVRTLTDRLGDREIRPVIDTWVLGGNLSPDLPTYSLEALAQAYGAQVDGTLHSAETAAKVAMRLAWTMYGKHKEVQTDARALHAWQARKFLPLLTRCAARAGRAGGVDLDLRWPMRPYVEKAPEPVGYQPLLEIPLDADEAAAVEALRVGGFTATLLGTTERIS